MRPKKVILCVGAEEVQLSVLSFTLRTNGFKAPTATVSGALEAFISEPMVDAVIVDVGNDHIPGDKLIERLKACRRHVPMILIAERVDLESLKSVLWADRTVERKHFEGVGMLEVVGAMATRKRGPRKGFLRGRPLETPALV